MNRKNTIITASVFLTFLLLFNLMMAAIWEVSVHERVYHCTDSLPFGYFSPGEWVHGEIRYVDILKYDAPMSDRDMMKSGWTFTKLWSIWWVMFSASTAASLLATIGLLRSSKKTSPIG